MLIHKDWQAHFDKLPQDQQEPNKAIMRFNYYVYFMWDLLSYLEFHQRPKELVPSAIEHEFLLQELVDYLDQLYKIHAY